MNQVTERDQGEQTSLTGIKPTNVPHLGNYLGAIRPALKHSERAPGIYFIADYHALTTVRSAEELRSHTYDVAATWLACGLDPERTILFRQSDVTEVFELAWVLSCMVATGQLERGHSYKDALAKGDAPNAGVFFYPVLMAADILLYDTHIVPVGADQKQHLELARDMAIRLNHLYGEGTVVVPEARLSEAPIVPGLDGTKMSKSKGNSIPLFASEGELKKLVMKFVTGSEPLEAPKEAAGTTVFELYRFFARPEEIQTLEDKLRSGGYGWGHAKQDLLFVVERELKPLRERYLSLRANSTELDRVLARGADRAGVLAKQTMARVRSRIGIGGAGPLV